MLVQERINRYFILDFFNDMNACDVMIIKIPMLENRIKVSKNTKWSILIKFITLDKYPSDEPTLAS